jgi:uncharacterized membrane protein YoaK (UPF0700 family)
VTAAGSRPHRVRDVLLAVLAFAAGSIDVLSWLALGKVFSAFMTGNVVFLAAGLFSHQSELSLHAAIALIAFGVWTQPGPPCPRRRTRWTEGSGAHPASLHRCPVAAEPHPSHFP